MEPIDRKALQPIDHEAVGFTARRVARTAPRLGVGSATRRGGAAVSVLLSVAGTIQSALLTEDNGVRAATFGMPPGRRSGRPLAWHWRVALLVAPAALLILAFFAFFGLPGDRQSHETHELYSDQAEPPHSLSLAPVQPRKASSKAINLLQTHLVPLLSPSTRDPETLLPYRTCMLTITRNEPHLAEFLVRSLLAGVDRIFLVDDNRVRLLIFLGAFSEPNSGGLMPKCGC